LQKHHLNKIGIALIAIAVISLAAGILTGEHAPRHDFRKLPQLAHDDRPRRAPEVVGKIISLVGNQATIAKLEQPPTIPTDQQRTKLDTLPPQARIAEMEERLNAFTGENIVVEIPAGIEITRRAEPPRNAAGVRELVSAQDFPAKNDAVISPVELAPGDFVAIWLDSTSPEKNSAEFINLIFTEKDATPKQ